MAYDGSRRGGERAAFRRDIAKFTGTDEEYDRIHYDRYGREEKMTSAGRHAHGSYQFPRGSGREKHYEEYSRTTRPRQDARDAYDVEYAKARTDVKSFHPDQKKYYDQYTGGLAPDQHERLDTYAKNLRDYSYSNARGRDNFMRAHPQGYHSKFDYNKHHRLTDDAYGEYEISSRKQKNHEEHRSYANIDSRRDKWGRPMSHRR